MVAGLLWAMGCWIGHTRYGDEFNIRGYFENTALKRLLKQTYGFRLLEDFPVTQKGWRRLVEREIVSQGYRRGPWLFKTGVHYAGVWDEFDPLILKVTRDRDSILESYARYGGIWRSFGPENATEIVDRGLERLRDLPGIEIDTDRLVDGDYSALKSACKTACLPYNERTVTDFIVPGVFHAG